MKKRTLLILATLCIIGLAVWIFLPARVGNSDESKYERWKETFRLYRRTTWWKRQLPQGLSQFTGISTLNERFLDEHFKLELALLKSGYLTNVTVTNVPPSTNSAVSPITFNQLRKACQDNGDEWTIVVRKEGVVLTCRPQDELVCRRALEQ